MPREIKFRAWDKKEKIMYKPRTVTDIPLEWGRTYPEGDIFVPRYEFMQFTGLRDSKRAAEYPEGQEIYEGDICKGEYGGVVYENEVIFVEGGFSIRHNNDKFGYCALLNEHESIEVIGNIWEEPNE